MRNWTNKISKHLSYTEATKSYTATLHGIDNTPNPATISKMKLVAEKVFEPVREHFGVAIGVTSFYRCEELNKKIKGSKNSQHCKGEAIDIDADIYGMVSNEQIFNYIKNNLDFDQLIWEFGTDKEPDWVHVSYKSNNNRKNVLKAYKEINLFGKKVTKYKYI